MELSNVALTNTLISQLTTQQNDMTTLQEQLATGQVLNQPSDNPAAVTQVLQLSSQASQIASWQTNIDTAQSWLSTATTTANSVMNELQSAQSLVLQAANTAVQDPQTYAAIGAQIQGITQNLLDLANTQIAGRALFAGTAATSTAYDASGNYLGNADTPTAVIGTGTGNGQTTDLSVPGTALFGSGSSNVFATLNALSATLQSGTPSQATISSAIDAINAAVSQAASANATLGNASDAVATVGTNLTNQLAGIQSAQSNLEDVNVATATSQLQAETTNYQAALWAIAQSVPDTLMKYVSL